ncbi:MAG: triple tyrosine motif-containing protein [Pyrinomonadaceae bacterium]
MTPKLRISVSFLTCAAALLLLTASIHGERLPVKIFTSADGLGSGFVDYLMRDSRGFMWFCTRNGLSRFDGSRFVNFQVGYEDSSPGVENIYETRGGIYWITTTSGSYRFDPSILSAPDPGRPSLQAEHVTGRRGQFFEDSRGTLWLISNGIFRLEEADGKRDFVEVDWGIPEKPNVSFVGFELTETLDGSMWLHSSWGLVRRLPDSRLVVYSFDSIVSSLGGGVAMIADTGGRIWMTLVNRVFIIKPESLESLQQIEKVYVRSLRANSVVEVTPDSRVQLPRKAGDVFELSNTSLIERPSSKRVLQTSDGDIWMTADDNLLQFSSGVVRIHSRSEGLPNGMVRMAEDAAGNLWIGGYAGLARLDRSGMVSFGSIDGAVSERFFAITEDSMGTLYFASPNSFVTRFSNGKLESSRPLIEPNSNHLWTSRFIRYTANGDCWVLSNGKLYLFEDATRFDSLAGKKPTRTFGQGDGLKGDGMFQIFEDTSGDIWVSTRSATSDLFGLSRRRNGEANFKIFGEDSGFPLRTSASSFAEDRNGNIWVGFYEGSIARFDGERFDVFTPERGFPGKGATTDLHVDGRGRLWISASGNGVFRIDDTRAAQPTYVWFSVASGLTSNNVRTLTEDKFGRIYAGSVSGVDRIAPDSGQIRHFSVNDGLAGDFVFDSHRDQSGALWFATNNGASRLVPLADEKGSPPRIFIGGLRIAGNEQPVSELGSIQMGTGDLSSSQNNFQIEFFGVDFRTGESLHYQYKLEGADADWSQPTDMTSVTYANLSPANYRFLVRGVNSEGTVSETPAVISFRILSPIWQRWWFVLGCVMLVAVIVLGLYRYRTARLRDINVALAEANRAEENLSRSRAERIVELERLRSRIATDLHDDIGSSLTQIAILSEVAQEQGKKGNGAAVEPLSKITAVSNELVGTMSDIVWSINPAKDHLSDLSQRMRRFASDVLASRSIRLHFRSDESADDVVLRSNLRREVFLIFKESINNIVKHSGATTVTVDLCVEFGELKLIIRDDGRGFDPEGARIVESGNGLTSMSRRTNEIGGRFEIASTVGHSTTVKASFPVENLASTQPPERVG